MRLIDRIEDPYTRAFLWRVYNTFKSVILPAVLPILIYELEQSPKDLSILWSGQLWVNIAYVSILALLGSTLAGLDKVYRST